MDIVVGSYVVCMYEKANQLNKHLNNSELLKNTCILLA